MVSPVSTPTGKSRGHSSFDLTPAAAGHNQKPVATLTSSLDIPVEGVLPIPRPILSSSNVVEELPLPITSEEPEEKRTPRKSKTDALAALHTRSISPFPGSGRETSVSMGIEDPRPSAFGDLPLPSIAVPRALDMKTVKTRRIPSATPSQCPRPFGLEDCLTFYPTVEEFSDPLNYLRSISDRAQQYGICKIVPPETWNMPFVTDTEVRK